MKISGEHPNQIILSILRGATHGKNRLHHMVREIWVGEEEAGKLRIVTVQHTNKKITKIFVKREEEKNYR